MRSVEKNYKLKQSKISAKRSLPGAEEARVKIRSHFTDSLRTIGALFRSLSRGAAEFGGSKQDGAEARLLEQRGRREGVKREKAQVENDANVFHFCSQYRRVVGNGECRYLFSIPYHIVVGIPRYCFAVRRHLYLWAKNETPVSLCSKGGAV